ncbi:hypothetical protein [Pontiella sulfatireligans]|uniref:Uncharacterized protein n=1 Tax=Pontiella sulfatireligans TaxID=2750658 RepID=A0A6C2USB2_9BACT|nr:hypothetical protein [Pontiella sulfatireligans]VGO22144.1 hypothetical protein SCARR_04225 [Pontiella sulfatireligans]
MNYENRLYMVLYPNTALIASQLEPKMFAKHYTSGSSRHYSGKLVFAEVDVDYRNDYFDIENMLKELMPHEDGRLKATKFIASYRVLEHVDFSAIGRLYLSTEEGHCIGLDRGEHDISHAETIRIYAEIAPMRLLVMSKLTPPEFGKRITKPGHTKAAPKQFYTQLNIDIPEFLKEFEQNPFKPSPVAALHPSTIRDAFLDLTTSPEKNSKGLSLDSNLDSISYRQLKHGFTFATEGENIFYPLPSQREIEAKNLKFWRTM